MITLKQPFGACSQMFQILIANYTSGEIFVVLRSWAVRLLSAFTVSARETNLLTHYSVQNTIKVKVGIVEQLQNIVPTFGAVMKRKVPVTRI